MPNSNSSKNRVIQDFHDHVSSGKVEFFRKYGMDFVLGRRSGAYLYDLDGKKRLFDLHCNGGVFNLGHRREELVALLKAALDELDIGNHHLLSRERAELARFLAELMPGDLTYTVFGVGGGESVDLAFKVARGYTGRTRIISARGGYHGHTGLALAAGDEKYRRPFGPPAPGFFQVPFGDLEALDRALDGDTAAVIMETVPATLGMVIPTRDYFPAVCELCTRKGVLMIMDEVQTGLGRTGKLWGFEHYGIVPDLVVLGKGLSGGLYPISATVMRRPLESVFHPDPFIHVSTFGGSELGCRIARLVLEISSAPEFLAHVNALAEQFRTGAGRLQKKYPRFLKDLRQLGLMMALRLRDEVSGPVLTKAAYEHDLLMIYANNDTSCCQLLPPLAISTAEAATALELLDKSLAAAQHLQTMVTARRSLARFWNKLTGKKTP